MTAPESSHPKRADDLDDFDEEGPGRNGDLVSWLYVIGGIPVMAGFLVVMFLLIGTCDAQNIMLKG